MEDILLSATQVSAWGECQRKFAFRTIAKIQSPPSPAMALGTEVDDTQLQPYLRDGRAFELGRSSGSGEIATSALEWLPAPRSPGLEVQKKFVLPGPSHERTGVSYGYLGYKDLWLPDSRVLPNFHPGDYLERKIPAVVDFKSTGDFKWALTESTLRTNPQAVIYAMNAIYETRAPAVDLVWLYMRTRGARKSRRVHLRMLAEDIVDEFVKIDAVGVEIVETRKRVGQSDPKEFALSLPPNPDACDNFGGCPYKSFCNLSPLEHSRFKRVLETPEAMMTTGSVDLFASIQKKNEAVDAPLGINPPEKNLPPAPPVGVVAAPPPADVPAVEDKPAAKRGRPAGSKNKDKQLELPVVAATEAAPETFPSADLFGDSFTVTWGQEKFRFGDHECIVGPFEVCGSARQGETLSDAKRRVGAVLHAFAVEERANKLESFKRAVSK